MRRSPAWLLVVFGLSLLLPLAGALESLPLDVDDPTAARPAPATAPPVRADAAAEPAARDGDYSLSFVCPDGVSGPPAAPVGDGALVCPTYVVDREDVFGQPVLVVDPRNPQLVGFSAMHGGRGVHPNPADQPPSERSRHNGVHQPHTTFRSLDGGVTWEDMPYYAPDALRRTNQAGQSTRDIYGEDNAATIDAQGRLYLAALYAHRDRGTTLAPGGEYRYAAGVWKAKPLDNPVDYNVNLKILHSGNDGANRVDRPTLAHVPATDVVVLAWREEAPAALVADGANASDVVLHWTRASDGAMWTRVDLGIGPCRAITNVLPVGDHAYVGCFPPLGDNDAPVAPLRVYGIDTRAWSANLTGEAPILDGHALLVARGAYGNMVLVASGLDEDRAPRVQVSYGELGGRWSSVDEFGAELTRAAGAPLLEARVTAAAYAPMTGHLHLVYMERYDLASTNQQSAGAPEFWKALASIRAEGAFQARLDLGVGTLSRVDFSPTLTGVGTGAFNDLHDSIFIWRGPDGRDREFIAYGDHGYVRFAEVTEANYPIVAPVFPASAPAVPIAAPGASPLLLGLPAGAIAGAMVARTIAARRQAALEVGAE